MTRIKRHKNLRHFLLITFFSACTFSLFAQEDSTATKLDKLLNMPDKMLAGISKKYSDLKGNIEKQSLKMLKRMQDKEAKLKKKLEGIDSTKAKELFNQTKEEYARLTALMQQPVSGIISPKMKEYLPGMDSMQNLLKFLKVEQLKIPGISSDQLSMLRSAGGEINELQARLLQTTAIQSFIREREASLKEALMNTGLAKELLSINKEVFYYQERLREYKELLKHPDQLEKKILETAMKLPVFQDFLQKHSYIAQLFRLPANYGTPQALEGVQTRSSIEQLIGQRIGTATNTTNGGASPQQYMQQQLSGAQAELSKLKDKLQSLGGGSSDMTIPDFKPNEQKTKTLWQRLEYGMNVQSEKSKYFFPVTTDIALTVGYKLSGSAVAGLGISYKIGWGSSWDNIRFSSEGIGLRSYVDIKARGNIWLSAGFEYNYMQRINNIESLKDLNAWTKSALLGLSKKYKITNKKQGSIQVLYDFLHNQQIPPTPALKFRVGWSL